MDKLSSAWVLCPSKKFPGLYYYFNTQTGEKAWSSTVSSGQTPDRSTAGKSKGQTTFGKVEFPTYSIHRTLPKENFALPSNFNKPSITNGSNITQRSRDSEQIVSTTTHPNKLIFNFKNQTTDSKLNLATKFKQVPNNPFSSKLAKDLEQPQDTKKFCEGTTSNRIFEPVFDFKFSTKRGSSHEEIEELNQAMKRAKISSSPSYISEQGKSEWNPYQSVCSVEFEEDRSIFSTQNRMSRPENVKVCINFLRNLSKSQYADAWYLVPDVEVLLENFNFIKKFIADDPTCALMTPAAVLAKLQTVRADRSEAHVAATAGQVLRWLAENAVCQTDDIDNCPADEATIHKHIVDFCKQANIFHLVIITKSRNLWERARRNDVHVYYVKALKIIDQKENLFLLDPNSIKAIKWPKTPLSPVNGFTNKNALKNIQIRVNVNGERSINQTFNKRENSVKVNINKRKGLENDVLLTHKINDVSESNWVEEKLKEFCEKHQQLQANINKRIDEWTCTFLQIMEYCVHLIFQRLSGTELDPPCWLYQGLQLLKERYYDKKRLCAIIDHLLAICCCSIINGIMRPNIKSDQFIKILGAGILLIEQIVKISEFTELSDCKKMLHDLIARIQRPDDFSDALSVSESCRMLGDETFRTERDGASHGLFGGFETTNQNENMGAGQRLAAGSSDVNSENNSASVILQKIDTGNYCVLRKLQNTVDMIRHALGRMKAFIELREEELNKSVISQGRKELLRKKSCRYVNCAAGMFEILKMIQKRENPNEAHYEQKFAVRSPEYTKCIDDCLKQVEIIQESFNYLLEALK